MDGFGAQRGTPTRPVGSTVSDCPGERSSQAGPETLGVRSRSCALNRAEGHDIRGESAPRRAEGGLEAFYEGFPAPQAVIARPQSESDAI
jgi:hypothetical protein